MSPEAPSARRRHLRLRDRPVATATLLTVQLLAVAAVLAWVSGRPLTPDGGLTQFDATTLREPVAGVTAVGGDPTIYVLTGDLAEPACATQLRRFLDRRSDAQHPAVLLVPSGPTPSDVPVGTTVRTDGVATLGRALALPDATQGCRPGYALVDGSGDVRYRTYDPGYGSHGDEQSILLDSLR